MSKKSRYGSTKEIPRSRRHINWQKEFIIYFKQIRKLECKLRVEIWWIYILKYMIFDLQINF